MSITVALVNDYEIVLTGLAAMLQRHSDVIDVQEIDANVAPTLPVDIALLSSFGEGNDMAQRAADLIADPKIAKVVLYTWNFDPDVIDAARALGVSGYLSKTLDAAQLANAIERIHAGEVVVTAPPSEDDDASAESNWPGREASLTERESEVLALIARGYSNKDIATNLGLSLNSVKTHIRHIYEKIVVDARSKAVVWALDNGFRRRSERVRQP